MNPIRMTAAAIATSALALSHGTVWSHQIWIEPAGAKAVRIQFGEFGENLREASPGISDKFVALQAQLLPREGTPRNVAVSKLAEGFALDALPRGSEALVAQDAMYPSSERKEGDRTLRSAYHPAARWAGGWAAAAPVLPLDVLPTGTPGEVQVMFNGAPLPKAKVVLVTASGWAREDRSDDSGKVSFSLPWRGAYLFEVSHSDRTARQRSTPAGSEAIDVTSYVSTLYVQQAKGLPALPPGPKAKPNPPPTR